MNIPNPLSVVRTPVGGAISGATVANLIALVILPPVWPWWNRQSTTWQGAVATVLIFVCGVLGAWFKLVHTPGQKMTLELTPGRLPTVQSEQPPAGG